MLKVILEVVCSLTKEAESDIKSKCRKWSLMYARYLFYDTAIRLGEKPVNAAHFIGRNRTMIYPYNKAVSDLIAVNHQFRNDREMVFSKVEVRLSDGKN